MVIDDFRNYAGGVYTTDNCKTSAKDVNHAVLAVGYGNDAASGLDYWTIKNSLNKISMLQKCTRQNDFTIQYHLQRVISARSMSFIRSTLNVV